MPLYKKVKNFLKEQYLQEKPLLIGFSGGCDSFALTHLLLNMGIHFELAHIDHAYRAQSRFEAQQLQEWAEHHHIIFHLKRLEIVPERNLEDAFRQERLTFFQELFQKKEYQALVLAHHQNDVEETTLKRLFEGAFITELEALKPVSVLNQMVVWRPLLQASKKELLEYAQKNRLQWIEDSTNYDGSNLRSKMRTQMIPELERQFGKKIRTSLSMLTQMSHQLKDYLKTQIKDKIICKSSPFGMLIDFSQSQWHSIERLFVLKELKIALSRDQLIRADQLIGHNSAHKKFIVNNQTIYIDRAKVMVIHAQPFEFLEKLKLNIGEYKVGDWTLEVKRCDFKMSQASQWQSLFQNEGRLEIQLPEQDYFLGQAPLSLSANRLSAKKIPSLLSRYVPALFFQDQIYEFYSGLQAPSPSERYLNVSLAFKKD